MGALRVKMRGRHHRLQRRLDRPLRIGQESCDASQGLVCLGIENMEYGADQERMTGLLPMVPLVERALGVDQDIGDVLDVTNLPFPAPHLEQWIVRSGLWIGWVEQENSTMPRAKTGRQLPISPLMSCTMAEPGQASNEGTTKPTPLPDRVGAKHKTCSGPSWRR
ncbi:hypothetical protein AB7M73_011095 [Bradyrhizobium japonicum]